MRLSLIVSLAACTACGDGIYVEVRTNGIDVASVELVMADSLCKVGDNPCDAIQGENFPFKVGRPGDLYELEAARATTNIVDGSAWFEIPPGDRTIDMAFAVGRDGAGKIVGIAVMPDTLDLRREPTIYRVDLDPAEPLLNRAPEGAGAAEWRTGADHCIGVVPVTPSVPGPIFIVPGNNPDCDATIGDDECDPLWFDGVTFDEPNAPHCAKPSEFIPGACMLGHVPTCIERADPDNPTKPCVESPECLPSEVCECEVFDEGCQQGKMRSEVIGARLDCQPPGELLVNEISACANNVFTIPSAAALVIDGQCVAAEMIEDPDVTFHSARGPIFTAAGSLFQIIGLDPVTCEIQLRWSGSAQVGKIAHTILVLTLDDGVSRRNLWIPLNFTPTESCTVVPNCSFVDNNPPDSLARCAM